MIYIFRQNNSGGYFIENEEVAKYVVIEANTREQALEILAKVTAGNSEYCVCCGERWYPYPDDEFKDIEEYEDWKDVKDWRSTISDEEIRFYESNPYPPYKLKAKEESQDEEV